MTLAEWCVLAAVLLYLLTLAPFKVIGQPRFDNQNPRDPEFWRSGIRARAQGAHINGIETFAFFAFAVLLAEFRHMPAARLDELAAAFVLLRLAFVAAYLLGWAWTRTVLWNVAFAINVAIFLMPLWA